MRIAHVIGYFQPEFGYEEYFTAREQANMGYEVHVVCADRIARFEGMSQVQRLISRGTETVDGIQVHRLKTLFEPYGDMIFVKGLKKKLKEINPDVVHGHTVTQLPSILAGLWSKEIGYKYFVDHHDFFYYGHPLNPIERNLKQKVAKLEYKWVRKYLSRIALKSARKVIAVADVCKSHLIDFHKVSQDQIFLNNLAVDTDRFHFDETKRKRVRSQLGILDNEFVLIFSGMVNPRKRVHLLVDVLSHFKNKPIRLLMVIRGEKQNVDQLKLQFEEAGLKEKVIFVENAKSDQMADYYSASDTAVWIANNSVAILEAMACHLPVIVPKMQLAHFVSGNGVLIDEGNVEECIKAVNTLYESPEKLKKFAETSYKNVEKFWSYKKSTENLIQLYLNG